jgi:hypothetical protein
VKEGIMRSRWATVGIVVPVIALTLCPRAIAGTSERSFTVTIVVTQKSAPERQWVDQSGILHIRDQRFDDAVSGDLTGTQVSMANIDLDIATGTGAGNAGFELDTDQGTWTGHLSGQIQDFMFSGELEGKGANGTEIRGRFSQTDADPETFVVNGTILDTPE